jgi:tRNA1Val (adenine37-N6)-methyltransferase
LDKVKTCLDIGTGCGILSLLLAARSPDIRIDAVELDNASAREAGENFRNSPYAGRLEAVHADINDFKPSGNKEYDLIVSNPPFFINDHRPQRQERKLARHTDSLSYAQLVAAVSRLLSPGGHFSVVLPYRESRYFLELAEKAGLFLVRQMLIFPKPCREPNRVNLLLGTSYVLPVLEKFIIRNEEGVFTGQYLDMVKNYYLSP